MPGGILLHMKLRYVLPCTVALFGIGMADAQSASTSSIPHLEKRGKATQLIVDGRPFLILAGELTNSASSSMEYMAPYWPKLAAANMNTVLAAVTWELVEPEPGKFDFALVDGAIREARRNHLRLIFLWFGSWKNGESTYTPLWVKKNPKQYPLFLAENGQAITYLSVFKEANWKADANAFAALMRHIREVDGEAHTVIMMQVENEVGCPGATRDQVPEAKAAFNAPVPKQLMDYMVKNKENLVSEFRQYWEAAGGKTSGTWAEVFGDQPMTNEIFMAWYYARYVDKVAKAGKAEYPLPMFINVDLGEAIGQYSSGGALPIKLNVWQQGAPGIDIIAPDIYLPDFAEWCARYDRSGNPLWIPETRGDAANAFYAIGNACCNGDFALRHRTPGGRYYALGAGVRIAGRGRPGDSGSAGQRYHQSGFAERPAPHGSGAVGQLYAGILHGEDAPARTRAGGRRCADGFVCHRNQHRTRRLHDSGQRGASYIQRSRGVGSRGGHAGRRHVRGRPLGSGAPTER